jgi:hypothetical protein
MERYVRSLEKAVRPPDVANPAEVYMDKEKEELIRQLLQRDRLVHERSQLLGELKEENQDLHNSLTDTFRKQNLHTFQALNSIFENVIPPLSFPQME